MYNCEVLKEEYDIFLKNLNWDFFELKKSAQDNSQLLIVVEKETGIIIARHAALLVGGKDKEWVHQFFIYSYPDKSKMKLPKPVRRITVSSWEQLQQIVNLIKTNNEEGQIYMDSEKGLDVPMEDVTAKDFIKGLQKEIEEKIIENLSKE